MPKDLADLHVERWRDHWIDIAFDDDVEAMTVRINTLYRYFKTTTARALASLDLLDSEYDTLHQLMIRDTPGTASPGDLAKELGVSAAGITGRLDVLERRGLAERKPGAVDRRRVDVDVTREGVALWRRAMTLRGDAEDDLAAALSPSELRTINQLLKKLTLAAEARPSRAGGG